MSIKSGLETVEELAKIKQPLNCYSSRFKLCDWGKSPQFLEHRKENIVKQKQIDKLKNIESIHRENLRIYKKLN